MEGGDILAHLVDDALAVASGRWEVIVACLVALAAAAIGASLLARAARRGSEAVGRDASRRSWAREMRERWRETSSRSR